MADVISPCGWNNGVSFSLHPRAWRPVEGGVCTQRCEGREDFPRAGPDAGARAPTPLQLTVLALVSPAVPPVATVDGP